MPGTTTIGTTTFATIFGEGTYSELIWAVGIVVVLQAVLSYTRSGIYTVASGGNRLGAAEAGINTRLVLVRNFVLCAITAGFAGILEGVRTTTITPDPSGSNQFLLYAVAAVIIGGTLMTGGEGTVVGALIGALFIGVLEDGLTIKSVTSTYLYLWLGIAIIIAMTINVVVRRVRVRVGPCLSRPSPASRSSGRRRRPTTFCGSSTSPSASDRSPRCATSTCIFARAKSSRCLATTAPASRR